MNLLKTVIKIAIGAALTLLGFGLMPAVADTGNIIFWILDAILFFAGIDVIVTVHQEATAKNEEAKKNAEKSNNAKTVTKKIEEKKLDDDVVLISSNSARTYPQKEYKENPPRQNVKDEPETYDFQLMNDELLMEFQNNSTLTEQPEIFIDEKQKKELQKIEEEKKKFEMQKPKTNTGSSMER